MDFQLKIGIKEQLGFGFQMFLLQFNGLLAVWDPIKKIWSELFIQVFNPPVCCSVTYVFQALTRLRVLCLFVLLLLC